jgi:predicted TIM-barrel fold metal-dependent hydrolase
VRWSLNLNQTDQLSAYKATAFAMIDVNVNLSRWPTRRLPCDEPEILVAKLRKMGVKRAWTGSLDALLHKDVAAVNLRLQETCNRHGDGILVPFGCVNPSLPDWEDDIRRCAQVHKMPGIRLHPNYHGYALDDPRCARLLDLAQAAGMLVQLAIKMEDERTQHPLMRVDAVDTTPLVNLVSQRPDLTLVLLNALRTVRPATAKRLCDAGNVYFDVAMLEGAGGIARLLKDVPLSRILFGSYLPVFNFESALLKLRESELTNAQLDAITADNAARLLMP